jgi:hypothetical protein
MTHIIKLLYGNDKRNPTRELSLTDLDANIYLQLEGFAPGGGQQNPLFSGVSSRFDGERFLSVSRANTRLQIKYSLSADNTQHLQVVQRKISRFMLDAMHGSDKVWLEYRWSIDGLDDLPRPVLGQLNHYLEIIHADVKQWPAALHSGQMIAGYVEGVAMDITGKPYWEGLENRAGDVGYLADTATDTAGGGIVFNLDDTTGDSDWYTQDWTIAGWILGRDDDDFPVFELAMDSAYISLWYITSNNTFTYSTSSSNVYIDSGEYSGEDTAVNFHFVMVHDTSANAITIYRNGDTSPYYQVAGQTFLDTTGRDATLILGGWINNAFLTSYAAESQTNNLDSWRVWDSALTASQINALYTSEAAIIAAGETIQYPLYFKTYAGDGVLRNTSGGDAAATALSTAVAYYAFDSSGTLTTDATGNGYTLTNNGPITTTTGVISNGALIDDPGNEYFQIAYGNIGDLNFGDNDFSFSMWISFSSNAIANPSTQGIFGLNDGSDNSYGMTYSIGTTPDHVRFYVFDGTFNDSVDLDLTPTADTWYFFVMYYDSVANEVGISYNGGAFTTASASTCNATTSASFTIGTLENLIGNAGNSFEGSIDEFAAYDYVISDEAIALLYNSGAASRSGVIEDNLGVLYGLPGDSLAKIRAEVDLPTSDTDRAMWAGLLPVDSSYEPTEVHYIDFSETFDLSGYSGGGYTAASTTSGAGTDTTTIEAALTTPGSLQPGRYRVLAHLRIVGGSATTATVTPYYRIGETTSPEQYFTDNSVDTDANFLWQDLGDMEISWPMDTLVKMTIGLKFAETATVTLTPAIDFIMLLPTPMLKAICEDATITIASGDTLHLDERRAWVEDASNSDSQLYHFHFEGEQLQAVPYKYNYLFVLNGEDNQQFTVANSSTVRVYVTPRWALPGGMVA